MVLKQMDQTQIFQVSKELAEKSNELLKYLDIDYREYSDTYIFCCPVHGGDNINGCSILKENGVWACWTNNCQEEYKKTLFGFVRGVLSHRKNKKATMNETMDFCLKFLNKSHIDPIPESTSALKTDAKLLEIFERKIVREPQSVTREQIRASLDFPCKYYLDRGYSLEILNKFDVGICNRNGKQMFGRAVVPIYDEHDAYVGCVGRSLINHPSIPKWINSKGFKKSQYLYGLNFAKEHIIKKGSVYIVEGQGDVWKMFQAGYYNTVGLFGCDLSDEQLILLETSGCMNLIILTDSDDAGNKAASKIIKKCGRRFNYIRPELSNKDPGEMTEQQLKELLGDS